MYRNGASSATTSNSRQRYRQSAQDRVNRYSSSYDSAAEEQNGLELSMHLPAKPFGNRFDVLSKPAQPLRRKDDYSIPPYHRWSRQSRGSREGKRRRDARRSRRKALAAQMLDEQLSREFDRTLSQANIHQPAPPPYNASETSPARPSTSSVRPEPIHKPATQAQLPYLNFGGLDLIDGIPPLTESDRHPSPPTPSPLLTPLPSWCPALPSFTNNTRWSDFPIFFDLSKLPEPNQQRKEPRESQQVQLWKPKISPQPKKESRFFPPLSPSKPIVKLPPVACKLHDRDQGVQDVRAIPETSDRATQTPEATVGKLQNEQSNACAANLWQLLNSSDKETREDPRDPYLDRFIYRPAEVIYAAPYGVYDHRLEAVGMPVELEDSNIPFVHGNSLTGHSNERAEFPVGLDSRSLTPAQELPVAISDLAIDLRSSSPTPIPETTLPVLFAGIPTACDADGGEKEMLTSDLHYQSEQALHYPPSPVIKPVDEEIVDIDEFLEMGHSPNCWCLDCDEPPELVDSESWIEDDDWMVYSQVDESQSPPSAFSWEAEWSDIDDEVSPYMPSSVAHGPW